MDWQTPLTALLVLASAAYAGWTVMPAALRRRVLDWFGHAPAAATGGCGGEGGCSGCGGAASSVPAQRAAEGPPVRPGATRVIPIRVVPHRAD